MKLGKPIINWKRERAKFGEGRKPIWKKVNEPVTDCNELNESEKPTQDWVEGEYYQYPAAIILPAPLPIMNKGDKVRIIIVKE